MYCPVRAVCTYPREYQYTDHPLSGSTNVLTLYQAIWGLYWAIMIEIQPLSRRTDRHTLDFDRYRSVPVGISQILTVTKAYRSICPSIFRPLPSSILRGFLTLFERTIDTLQYVPYRARLDTLIEIENLNLNTIKISSK